MERLPQALPLKGVKNARDLGGYPAADGRRVKPGLLLRSGALWQATEDDLRLLQEDYRLGAVVDFRTSAETGAQPDPTLPGVMAYRLLVLDENSPSFRDVSDPVTVHQRLDSDHALLDIVRGGRFEPDIYGDILLSPWGVEAYRSFFRVLLRGDGAHAILFHCTAGKDRTGIAAALLLTALGADRETVLGDYALTNRFLSAQVEQAAALARSLGASDREAELVRGIAGVTPAYLSQMLDRLNRDWGGVFAFLSGPLCLDGDGLHRLRALYLE